MLLQTKESPQQSPTNRPLATNKTTRNHRADQLSCFDGRDSYFTANKLPPGSFPCAGATSPMSHQNGYLGQSWSRIRPEACRQVYRRVFVGFRQPWAGFDHGCIPDALDLTSLDAASQAAAAAFVAAGTAENIVRSYRSALTYWTAWLQGRYGQPLGDAPLPVAVVVQFVLDHLACPQDGGTWAHLLPPTLDTTLLTTGMPMKNANQRHADAIIFGFQFRKACSMPFGTSSTTTA